MSTLILTLPAPGAATHEYTYCLATSAQAVGTHGVAALALLPRADDTVLLLPSTAVSWHAVTLPKMSRALSGPRLRALLESMVEELVLDDTKDLHIAQYRSTTAADPARSWLAVCQKTWLEQHLRAIQGAGRKVNHILPAAFPLTAAAGSEEAPEISIHISGSAENPLLTATDTSGVTTVPLAHARSVWPDLDSHSISALTAEPAVAAAAEAALNTKVATIHSSEHALKAMLQARSYGVDLAQGDLTVTGSGRWLQQAGEMLREVTAAPAWRAARVGFVLLLLAQVIGLNAWAWRERSTLEAKRAMVKQQFMQSFPEIKVVLDAPVQMQRELGNLRHASGTLGNSDFESLYARFASVAQVSSAPSAITFESNELSLKGLSLDSAQLGSLADALQAAQLSVRADGDRVVVKNLSEGKAP
jgi:general secretion pathway protein L